MTNLPTDRAAFLHGEIDAAGFRHRDHVRMGCETLARHPFLEAAAAVERALKAMTARAGVPGAYHATVTVAFLALINERREMDPGAEFERFADANPDLFDKDVLKRWYGENLREPL